MADTQGATSVTNDRCGCPSPCVGEQACRCKGSEGEIQMRCPCGDHCECNPCNCTKTQVLVTGKVKVGCNCGAGCSCTGCGA